MTPEKKQARKERNKAAKLKKAETKKSFLALLGRAVTEKQVPTDTLNDAGEQIMKTVLDFPPFIRTAADGSILPEPRQQVQNRSLAFVGAKQYPHHGSQGKTRPGNNWIHAEAFTEDASRALAIEIDKVLNPPPAEEIPIPVIPTNVAEEAAKL